MNAECNYDEIMRKILYAFNNKKYLKSNNRNRWD